MTPIHALVAVSHDNDARKLSRFLGDRGCVVDVRNQGDHALELVRQARGQTQPVDLLLADHRLYAIDGLSLIGQVHRMEPTIISCLLIDAHRIDDRLRAESRSLGCRHLLATPLDFGKLQAVVERLQRQRDGHTAAYTPTGGSSTGTGSYAPQASPSSGDDNTPFFGTRRLTPGTRNLGSRSIRKGEAPAEPEADSGVFDSLLSPDEPVDRSPGNRPGTRRSIKGTFDHNLRTDPTTPQGKPAVSGTFDDSAASPTQRIRRAVTGRIDRDQNEEAAREHTNRITRAAIQVRCAHCSKPFSVVRKSEVYTMPCIHCGKVNTISTTG